MNYKKTMKISFINESMHGYGADETTKAYIEEAKKRGFEVSHNVINDQQDFYIIGMFYYEHEKELKKFLKPKKYLYIEHSIESLLPEKQWIRDWLMPNTYKNLFFSPRHRQHCEDGMPAKDKHLFKDNIGYIVVPIDYNFFKQNTRIIRRDNYYLFVGWICSNKGVLDILRIAERNPQNIYTFVGHAEGSDFDVNKFKAYKNVNYLGHKGKSELPSIYSQHKYIILLPNNGSVESAGRCIFEGILCGCEPIVNNDVGNASYSWWKNKSELIRHIDFSNAFLFNLIEKGIKEIK